MGFDAGVVILDTVDSTMAAAARRAPERPGPIWILAREQTASRGRRGRPWRQGQGNFAATLLLEEPDLRRASLRSFVIALALHEALGALGIAGLALKWPNDVLVGGGKAAGILLETLPQQHLAIGVGINLREAPGAEAVEPGALPPVALGLARPPEHVLHILAAAYARWEDRFQAEGFAAIRSAWLARAARLGDVIRARTITETHEGIFETIDSDGQLVVSTPSGRRSIPAADVFF